MYRYGEVHFCKLKITELVPGKKLVWQVLDNRFNLTKDEREWRDTDVIFEIVQKGDRTEIRFTHRGSIPRCEWFDVCSSLWSYYIEGSLQSRVTTGEPTRKKQRRVGSNSTAGRHTNMI